MASRVWVPLFGPLSRRSANGKGDQGRRDESSERAVRRLAALRSEGG